MIPLEAIKYTLLSAVIVVCFFLGMRCLFAHELRREAWRSGIKRHVYISRQRFKIVTILAGWVFLFLSLYVAYFQILHLLGS